MCEIESIQPYHYQNLKGIDLEEDSDEEYDVLEAQQAILKEEALAQTCRLENHLKAQKSSAKESKKSSNRLSSHLERSVLGSAVKNLHRQYYGLRSASERFKNKGTQTDYRENECQTVPWEPPYFVRPGHEPEVLTIAHLTWDQGLPAGAREIELINRMRKRRAWEQVLPPMDTPANIKTRTKLISALEADEWAYRDAEIQFIMNLRMKLAEELLQEKESKKQKIMDLRLRSLDEKLNERKQKEIKNIRNKFSRELRKLSLRHQSAKVRHNKRDIVKLQANRQLIFRAAKPRYECPQVQQKLQETESLFDFDEKPTDWLFTSTKRKQSYSAIPKPSVKICPRVHQRNERKFRQLCRNLEAIETANAEATESSCSLLKRKPTIPSLPSTPRRSTSETDLDDDNENDEDEDEEMDQSASLLQRLVKGRAIQSEILEGRNRYKELIEELQSARALERHAEDTKRQSPTNLAEDLESLNEKRASEILEAIEGKTIAKMLTFLTDELTRLEGEKRAHALALLAERERIRREIEQASKEQLELNRRDELDEMFRQILKVNQESIVTYLEDIVKEGIEWSSAKEAEEYILDLADKTDAIAKSWEENAEAIDEEGLVSDMLYNLVLPEVEKESARERLQERQRGYLRAAHASIYQATLNLVTTRYTRSHACKLFTRLEDTSNRIIDQHDRIGDETATSFDNVIEIILDYAELPDDEDRSEVHDILEEMFIGAKNKK